MLSRSQKTFSLLAALGGFLSGMAILAGPAMALSLNPDAGSPGISKVNDFHTIIFIVIAIAIVVVNVAIIRAARPRTRHVPSSGGSGSSSERKTEVGLGALALVIFVAAIVFFYTVSFVLAMIAIALIALTILRIERNRQDATGSSAQGTGTQGQAAVGIGLGFVALAIFVTATVFSDQSREVPVSSETVAGLSEDKQLEIRATGQQWLWRFQYPNGAFTYHRLVVPAGVTVALRLDSIDVIHGWNVPSLTGKADAVPGQSNRVYFRADEEGVYKGRSSILSGQGYDTMEAEVEVVSPQAYESYIEGLKTDIQSAQDSVGKSIAGDDAG